MLRQMTEDEQTATAAFLMDPAHHQIRVFHYQVGERRFYAMPYPKPAGGEYFIWGATAGMLRNFYQLLRA